MKVIMYGAEICPDCVEAKAVLAAVPGIDLEYRNITENTRILKEFLYYRDQEALFAPVKEAGSIGIPLFVLEDGAKTFDIGDFTELEGPENNMTSCSLDGKGYC